MYNPVRVKYNPSAIFNDMNRILKLLTLAATLLLPSVIMSAQDSPKREFRGAWLHVIGQTQYANMSTGKAKEYIADQMEKLYRAGCNAVIFQVRPCADAVYRSEIEPWSQYLTGRRGKAPSPQWDPMEFAIEEAHKRGMEFHAWLNPYRISTKASEVLPGNHIASREPWRTFKYNNMLFFDPGIPENRKYIAGVVRDIVQRYDIDAIHMDDYFYPYPAAGKSIPDQDTYARYGNGMKIGDWRRHNVNLLIEELNAVIKTSKPWVRFGISPFGIWRNKKTDPRGSDSNGLQNYDALYADVLLWTKNKWVDYIAPQLYWELDHTAAPSRKLARWWNDNANGVDLYIGQDTKRTMDKADAAAGRSSELQTKIELSRSLPNVGGNVWWHGYWVTGNYKGVADQLADKFQQTIALPPAYGDRRIKPHAPTGLRIVKENGRSFLEWKPWPLAKSPTTTDGIRFVVYEFFPGEKADIDNGAAIIALTPCSKVALPGQPEKGTTLIVTALDRMNRESEPVHVIYK